MEFKRIPFIAVQRKFNLTDRQMYYIRDRIRKYHKEDEWFIFEYNAIGEKELWIYLEGVHWIEEVYLQYDTPYIEPEIKLNPITKTESVRFSKAEFEQIKQVINYQQIKITSLEAQKSDLNAELEINKQTINRIKNKPYVLENERLSAKLEKNKSKIDKFDEISIQNQQLKNQINTLNNLQVENNNLKLELEKEKQRSENFKIIGKLYQCMYLHLMDRIIPSIIQKFKIVKLIRNGLDNLFIGVLDEYQNKSKNPDIYTQLFDDNTDLNNSYPNIDQEFANIPDVDELIEISELDREKDHDHCR